MSTEPSIASRPGTKLDDRWVWGVMLCLFSGWLYWMGRDALASRERFAAPTWFLALCIVAGISAALGWILAIQWRAKLGKPMQIYSILPAGLSLVFVQSFPQTSAAWLDMFEKFSWQERKAIELQAEAVVVVAFAITLGLGIWRRKSRDHSNNGQLAQSDKAIKCQRRDSL